MKKEFVPYELNKKLVELGCDKKSCAAYKTKSYSVFKEGELYFNNHNYFSINAILWQQAFDWFREKYNLFSTINFYRENGFNHKKYYFCIDVYEVGFERADNFITYEQARLKCLEKLIEIVKTEPLCN